MSNAPLPFPPPSQAEFLIELAGAAYVVSFLSAKLARVSLAADRGQSVLLAQGGAPRALAEVLLDFEAVRRVWNDAPVRPAPLAGAADDQAQGPAARLFNDMWPRLCAAIDAQGVAPADAMAALCAMTARAVAALAEEDQQHTYQTFCHNLGQMINAEARIERQRARLN